LLQQKNHFEKIQSGGASKNCNRTAILIRRKTRLSRKLLIKEFMRLMCLTKHRNHFGYILIMAYQKTKSKKKIVFGKFCKILFSNIRIFRKIHDKKILDFSTEIL